MSKARRASTRAPRRTTLRARLTLAVTLLCLSVLTLAGVTTYLGARAALRQDVDNTLLDIARVEITSSVDDSNGKIHVHASTPSALQLPSGSGYEKFAQVENNDDQVVALTGNLTKFPLQGDAQREAQARKGVASFGNLMRGADELRVLYYPLRDWHGNPLITICAVSQTHLRQSLQSLRNTLMLMLTASGLLAAWGANRLARRLTLPLERIAQDARAIHEGCLHARLSAASQDAELHDLTEILNAMLTRLEAAFTTQQRLMDSQRRFLADASHELRSPLANLRGTIEVALRRPRHEEEYRETLTASMIEIERLSRLVNELLTLSRADTEQVSLHFAPCDLAEIARRAATTYAARAEQAHLSLRVEANDRLPVRGDAHRLRQIIDNLLDNALHYAPAGSCIGIEARREGEAALVTVRDEGPGITAEDQMRVFDRFYRADQSRARSTGGLGLGLAIARAFADAHKGNLSVKSVLGQGTDFTLALPLFAADDEAPDEVRGERGVA